MIQTHDHLITRIALYLHATTPALSLLTHSLFIIEKKVVQLVVKNDQ